MPINPSLLHTRALNCHHQLIIFLFVHNLKHWLAKAIPMFIELIIRISHIQGYNGDKENLEKCEQVSEVLIFHINFLVHIIIFLAFYTSCPCYKWNAKKLAYMLLPLLFTPFNPLINQLALDNTYWHSWTFGLLYLLHILGNKSWNVLQCGLRISTPVIYWSCILI